MLSSTAEGDTEAPASATPTQELGEKSTPSADGASQPAASGEPAASGSSPSATEAQQPAPAASEAESAPAAQEDDEWHDPTVFEDDVSDEPLGPEDPTEFQDWLNNVGFGLGVQSSALNPGETVDLERAGTTVWNSSAAGTENTIQLKDKGLYTLVAEGGRGGGNSWTGGGYGGRTKAVTPLDAQTLYAVTGGAGVTGRAGEGKAGSTIGGANGGGDGGNGRYRKGHGICSAGGSGGGASHIATAGGTLAEVLSGGDSDVLVVAGGGGGAGWKYGGGAGGGVAGGRGTKYNGGHPAGGSQTGGYQMGQGQTGAGGVYNASYSAEGRGGGGGGYWGGCAATNTSGKSNSSGAGGSGFLSPTLIQGDKAGDGSTVTYDGEVVARMANGQNSGGGRISIEYTASVVTLFDNAEGTGEKSELFSAPKEDTYYKSYSADGLGEAITHVDKLEPPTGAIFLGYYAKNDSGKLARRCIDSDGKILAGLYELGSVDLYAGFGVAEVSIADADGNVSQTTPYLSVDEAFAAAKEEAGKVREAGSTDIVRLELLTDCVGELAMKGDITVDYKLTTIASGHTIDATDHTFTVAEGAEVSASGSSTNPFALSLAGGSLSVTGGSVSATTGSAVVVSDTQVTMSGGTLSARTASSNTVSALSLSGASPLAMSGGTISTTNADGATSYAILQNADARGDISVTGQAAVRIEGSSTGTIYAIGGDGIGAIRVADKAQVTATSTGQSARSVAVVANNGITVEAAGGMTDQFACAVKATGGTEALALLVNAGTTTIRGAATVTASGATTNQGVRFADEAGNATIEPVIYIFTLATGTTPVGVSPAEYEAWTDRTTGWVPQSEFAYAFSQSKVPTVGALGGTENQGITNESASCKVHVDGSRYGVTTTVLGSEQTVYQYAQPFVCGEVAWAGEESLAGDKFDLRGGYYNHSLLGDWHKDQKMDYWSPSLQDLSVLPETKTQDGVAYNWLVTLSEANVLVSIFKADGSYVKMGEFYWRDVPTTAESAMASYSSAALGMLGASRLEITLLKDVNLNNYIDGWIKAQYPEPPATVEPNHIRPFAFTRQTDMVIDLNGKTLEADFDIIANCKLVVNDGDNTNPEDDQVRGRLLGTLPNKAAIASFDVLKTFLHLPAEYTAGSISIHGGTYGQLSSKRPIPGYADKFVETTLPEQYRLPYANVLPGYNKDAAQPLNLYPYVPYEQLFAYSDHVQAPYTGLRTVFGSGVATVAFQGDSGETELIFPTADEAFAAARANAEKSDLRLSLIRDAPLSNDSTIDFGLTTQMNGHAIVSTSDSAPTIHVSDGASIVGGETTKTYLVNDDAGDEQYALATKGVNVDVTGGSVSVTNAKTYTTDKTYARGTDAAALYVTGGNVTVSGGSLSATSRQPLEDASLKETANHAAGIWLAGGAGDVVVSGGTINASAPRADAVFLADAAAGSVSVSGGELAAGHVDGATAAPVFARAVSTAAQAVTLTGGTLTATSPADAYGVHVRPSASGTGAPVVAGGTRITATGRNAYGIECDAQGTQVRVEGATISATTGASSGYEAIGVYGARGCNVTVAAGTLSVSSNVAPDARKNYNTVGVQSLGSAHVSGATTIAVLDRGTGDVCGVYAKGDAADEANPLSSLDVDGSGGLKLAATATNGFAAGVNLDYGSALTARNAAVEATSFFGHSDGACVFGFGDATFDSCEITSKATGGSTSVVEDGDEHRYAASGVFNEGSGIVEIRDTEVKANVSAIDGLTNAAPIAYGVLSNSTGTTVVCGSSNVSANSVGSPEEGFVAYGLYNEGAGAMEILRANDDASAGQEAIAPIPHVGAYTGDARSLTGASDGEAPLVRALRVASELGMPAPTRAEKSAADRLRTASGGQFATPEATVNGPALGQRGATGGTIQVDQGYYSSNPRPFTVPNYYTTDSDEDPTREYLPYMVVPAITGVAEAEPLTYTGEPQVADVTTKVTSPAGVPGTFVYSLEPDGTYSEQFPSFTDAGQDTVYYKILADGYAFVSGDDDHASLTVNVEKAPVEDAYAGWWPERGMTDAYVTFGQSATLSLESLVMEGGELELDSTASLVWPAGPLAEEADVNEDYGLEFRLHDDESLGGQAFEVPVRVTGMANHADYTIHVRIAVAPFTYQVAYHEGEKSLATSPMNVMESAQLTAASQIEGLARPGWTFVGWATSPTSTDVAYADAATVENLTYEHGATVGLYAVWERPIEFVSYAQQASQEASQQASASGAALSTLSAQAEGAPATEVVQRVNGSALSSVTAPDAELPAADRGWSHVGWTSATAADAAVEHAAGDTFAPAADGPTTFFARYERTATITYDGGGATAGETAPTTQAQQASAAEGGVLTTPAFTLAENGFERDGYAFDGWDLGAAGTTYATWKPAVDEAPEHVATARWRDGSGRLAPTAATGDPLARLPIVLASVVALAAAAIVASRAIRRRRA
nr:glycine-rich protein [Olsenella intestinalis]